jgi:phage gp29-like protein
MQEDTVRLAILERNQENTEKEMSALREAISQISQVNVRISELLAVHQVKIEQQQQKEEDLNKKVESGISKLTHKMDTDRDEIYQKMDLNKTEVLNELRGLRNIVYTGAGIFLTLQLIFMVWGPKLLDESKRDLTNPEVHAKVENR